MHRPAPHLVVLLSVFGLLAGCSFKSTVGDLDTDGSINTDGGITTDATPEGSTRLPPGPCEETPRAAPTHRLTLDQWSAAAEAAFGVPVDETEPAGRLDASRFDQRVFETAITAADRVATALSQEGQFACPLDDVMCVEQALLAAAEVLFRRRLTLSDQAQIVGFYRAQPVPALGVHDTVRALLLSPETIFLREVGVATDGRRELTGPELATRLSLMVQDAIPDEELRVASESGPPETWLRPQLERLLADVRGTEGMVEFTRWWLRLGDVDASGDELPQEVAERMDTENGLFIASVFESPTPQFRTLFTGQYTFVDDTLAAHYGLTDRPGDTFARVDLLPNRYSSLLTQGAYTARFTNPTSRGVGIVDRILCQEVPEPPADLPPLDITGQTRREQWEDFGSRAECAGCHVLVDPVGFAFESFDRFGRYQTTDNGAPVDNSWGPVLFESPRAEGVGPVDFANALVDAPEALECVPRRFLEYGLRREVSESDACTLTPMVEAFSRNTDFYDVLRALVATEGFRAREDYTASPAPDQGAETLADYLIVRARFVQGTLPEGDRGMLDAYLDAVREVELRGGF